ncbi:MAG: DbpA RNA binding domain-containing protein [Methylococcaceae bacterium]
MEQNNTEAGNEELKNCLKSIIADGELSSHQQVVRQLSSDLQISILDCATALLLFLRSESLDLKVEVEPLNENKKNIDQSYTSVKPKSVRYRMEVGRMHDVLLEDIKVVLVEVSGVEYNRIGRIEIRNHYTLVDLPDGMPADIFQLLSETEISRQKLSLKRIKLQRRTQRRRKRY